MNQNAVLFGLIGGVIALGGVSYYFLKTGKETNTEFGLTTDQVKMYRDLTKYHFGGAGTKRRNLIKKRNKTKTHVRTRK